MTIREAILAADDRNRQKLDIPEWGQSVYVQVMTGHGRAKVEKAYVDHKGDGPRIMCAIVAEGVVDADGNRIFTEAGDAEALMAKSLDTVERLYLAVMKHNHADAKSMERVEGKSEAPRSTSS